MKMPSLEPSKEKRIADLVDFMGEYITTYDIGRLDKMNFFTAPASTRFHGNYEGGLFDHSFKVAETLVRLTKYNNLDWERKESPYIIGMFHDLCKTDYYISNGTGHCWEYNDDCLLKGHGEKSVMLLSQFYTLTEEEIMCIRYHMGAFTPKEEWSDYTRAVHTYPNVLWTHHADMIASHVHGI